MKNYILILILLQLTSANKSISTFPHLTEIDIEPSGQFFQDKDGDGYGNPDVQVRATHAPMEFVNNSGDCNDNDPKITFSKIHLTYYKDFDRDGVGDHANFVKSCYQPSGYVLKK